MSMKPVANRFIDDLMADVMPSAAAMVDFGLNNGDQFPLYEAYQKGIRSGEITFAELNEALGDGPKLTALVQRINPELTVKTDYDDMEPPA